MKIENIEIRNFLTVSEIKTRLDDVGIVAIMGVNKVDTAAESNGSGKSSFADAVCWCLWGNTARGESGDDVIRSGQKEAHVSLVLYDEAAGTRHLITRERTKGKPLLKVELIGDDGVMHDMTSGTTDLTQDTIVGIMGCTETVFRSVVYLGQEDMPDLPKMTDKNLKEIVEEAAGVQRLYAAHAKAKSLLSVAVEKLAASSSAIEVHEARIATIDSQIPMIDASIKENDDAKRKNLERLHGELSSLKSLVVHLETKADAGKLEAARERVVACEAAISAMVERQREYDEVRRRISSLSGELSHAESLLSSRKRAVATKKMAVDDIHSRIGTPCSECGTIITPDKLEHAKKHAMDALTEAVNEARASMKDVEDKRKQIAALGELLNPKVAEEARQANDDLLKAKDDLRSVIGTLGGITENKTSIKRLMDHIAEVEASVNPSIATKKKMLDNKAAIQEELEAAKGKHDELLQEEENHRNAVAVFGPAGVRAHILDQVTPYLNERTAFYLASLTDGKISAIWSTLTTNAKGELREKFSIDVKHDDTGKKFKGLSGGEKRRVRLACAFALQDLVATRANKPIHLVITDEIDDALDTPGLERLMSVMQDKARERGTVMVISHNDLKSWIGECWTVTKTDKGSTLSDGR